MDFKIFNLENYEAEVCIHRGRSEEGGEIVNLTSFIFNEDEDEFILETVMSFPSAEMAQNFVRDYSVDSATDWLIAMADEQGINLQA